MSLVMSKPRNSTFYIVVLVLLTCISKVNAGSQIQEVPGVIASLQVSQDTTVLSFQEFLGYVKRHHPVAKQAELLIDEGQANLLNTVVSCETCNEAITAGDFLI